MMTQERKKDTHQKIQLGGLVVKAGLREADKAVLLGALLHLAKEIEEGTAKISDYKSAGDLAFSQDNEEDSI